MATNNNVGSPQPPLRENFEHNLVINDCITNPKNLIVLPPEYDDSVEFEKYKNFVPIEVVKFKNPEKTYMRINEIAEIDLSHHYQGWGVIYFGVILPRKDVPGHDEKTIFQMPSSNLAKRVAIKKLSKNVVNEYLQRGGNENPYKEIQRMQMYGDNHHVLSLYEALHDEDFLYIIMPYCDGGNLANWIFSEKRLSIHEHFLGGFAAVYLNLLENIKYLHRHGICHRDLSPDNCAVLNGRIVLIDFAMSFRIPSNNDGSTTMTTNTRDFFGKTAYLPPEIVSGFHYFEATVCDLWSSVIILFNLLTGEIAWETSLPHDVRFRYLVLAGALSRMPVNERTVEILADEPVTSSLRLLAEKCLDLNPNVADLLGGVLKLDPNQRWKTQQVQNCLWLEAFRQLE